LTRYNDINSHIRAGLAISYLNQEKALANKKVAGIWGAWLRMLLVGCLPSVIIVYCWLVFVMKGKVSIHTGRATMPPYMYTEGRRGGYKVTLQGRGLGRLVGWVARRWVGVAVYIWAIWSCYAIMLRDCWEGCWLNRRLATRLPEPEERKGYEGKEARKARVEAGAEGRAGSGAQAVWKVQASHGQGPAASRQGAGKVGGCNKKGWTTHCCINKAIG